ncbi:hypothetical protein [Streptomyces sp. PSKA30]|uniref:hypothetical protein n=1 Tax=Streptomyces sp. PSKA30 TaxID=2874597 RepID=UPI001CD06798|nr:hypothetical protein [Streptomyces sp. PSKA30]MBZ9644756.1 hypothetical protein [Streptomyces sp. PSKA30]
MRIPAQGSTHTGGQPLAGRVAEQYFAFVSHGFKVHQDAAVGPEFLINAALGEMLPSQPSHTVLRHIWLTDSEAHALEAPWAPTPRTCS